MFNPCELSSSDSGGYAGATGYLRRELYHGIVLFSVLVAWKAVCYLSMSQPQQSEKNTAGSFSEMFVFDRARDQSMSCSGFVRNYQYRQQFRFRRYLHRQQFVVDRLRIRICGQTNQYSRQPYLQRYKCVRMEQALASMNQYPLVGPLRIHVVARHRENRFFCHGWCLNGWRSTLWNICRSGCCSMRTLPTIVLFL